MTLDAAAPTLVLTTASPGLAWECLRAAGVDPYEAALITSPGVAVAGFDGEFGRELAVITSFMKGFQVAVVGHCDDPVFGAPLPPEPGRPPGTGTFPGLGRDAQSTVLATVNKLLDCWMIPRGTVVSGLVIEDDGNASQVALEIARGGRKPASADGVTIRVQGREVGWDDIGVDIDRDLDNPDVHVLDEAMLEPLVEGAARPADPEAVLRGHETSSGPIDGGGQVSLGASSLGGKIGAGPSVLGGSGAIASGPGAIGGADGAGPLSRSGPIGSGHSENGSGPQKLGRGDDALSRKDRHRTERSQGAAQLGSTEIPAARAADHGKAPAPTPEAVAAEPIATEPIGTEPIEGPRVSEVDLLDQWFEKEKNAPKTRAPEKPNTLQNRLEDAAVTLSEFIDGRCLGHGQCKETRRLLQAGASPGAVMRSLLTLVREFGHDRPDVHAAYSTLEMAQSLLSKEEMRLVLRRVLL